MKGKKFRITAVAALLGFGVFSAHGAVDEDFMRYVEDTYKSADSNVSLKDVPAASKDATELVELFKEVEAFYVQKGNEEDGVKLSRRSVELSETLLKSLAANDFDSAATASQDIGKACKSCHNIYKD